MARSSRKTPTIFDRNYWDRPSPKAQGAAEPRLLYQAVGEALSQWEQDVDQRLADLFLVFVSEPSTSAYTRHAIRRAYGAIFSTANRREAIRTASEVYFPTWMTGNKAEQDGLRNILNAAGWAANSRDDLAHGRGVEDIEVVTKKDQTVLKTEQFGTFLMPPEYNTGRTFTYDPKYEHFSHAWRARYAYNDQDIRDIKMKFWELGVEIRKYVEVITPYVERARNTFSFGTTVGDLDATEAMRIADPSLSGKTD